MEGEDTGGSKLLSSMSQKIEKTKNNTQWLAAEIEKMRSLNPNSEYLSVLNSFQLVSDGIQKVKETLDPTYDHYEVLPRKIDGKSRVGFEDSLIR